MLAVIGFSVLQKEHTAPRFMIHSLSSLLSSLTAHNSQVTPHTDVIQYHIGVQSDWMTPYLLACAFAPFVLDHSFFLHGSQGVEYTLSHATLHNKLKVKSMSAIYVL